MNNKGNRAYILMGGRYILCEDKKKLSLAEYLTSDQVDRINNLLIAKRYIDREISLIKKGSDEDKKEEPKDELISKSELSNRAKNIFSNMNFSNLSDIAKHPFSKWKNWRNMGVGTIEETKNYLIKRGFILNEI